MQKQQQQREQEMKQPPSIYDQHHHHQIQMSLLSDNQEQQQEKQQQPIYCSSSLVNTSSLVRMASDFITTTITKTPITTTNLPIPATSANDRKIHDNNINNNNHQQHQPQQPQHNLHHKTNWRLSHDIHHNRKRVFQQILTYLYQTMNVEEVALRYENIIYDGSYSLHDYEDPNCVVERVHHLFSTDNAEIFFHDIASSSSSQFQLQQHPLARHSMKKALLLSSSSSSSNHSSGSNHPTSEQQQQQQQLERSEQRQQQQQQQPPPAPKSQQQPTLEQSSRFEQQLEQQQFPSQNQEGDIDDDIQSDGSNDSSFQTSCKIISASLQVSTLPSLSDIEKDGDIDDKIHDIVISAFDDYNTYIQENNINRDELRSSSPPVLKRMKYHHDNDLSTNDDMHPPPSSNSDIVSVALRTLSTVPNTKQSNDPRVVRKVTDINFRDDDANGGSLNAKIPPKQQQQQSKISQYDNKRKRLDHIPSSQQNATERKIQRLIELYHAARCPYEKKLCPTSRYCYDIKQLWAHLETCTNNHCKWKHCYTSRRLLAHYKACTNCNCRTCQPVRHYIANTSSSSFTRTESARNMSPPTFEAMIGTTKTNGIHRSQHHPSNANSSCETMIGTQKPNGVHISQQQHTNANAIGALQQQQQQHDRNGDHDNSKSMNQTHDPSVTSDAMTILRTKVLPNLTSRLKLKK